MERDSIDKNRLWKNARDTKDSEEADPDIHYKIILSIDKEPDFSLPSQTLTLFQCSNTP
jgi:hypothetical protein